MSQSPEVGFFHTMYHHCLSRIISLSSASLPADRPPPLLPSLQDQILDACTKSDALKLRNLLSTWEDMLMKRAAGSGGVKVVQCFLDRDPTNDSLDQKMLVTAAQYGNVSVFEYLLHKRPSTKVDDDIRSYALEGGVGIWKVILDHNPDFINWDFGEKGDLIAMTALMNNVSLLAYFLDKGLDPNRSQFFLMPTLKAAINMPHIKREIIDLLIEYGATMEKSEKALNEWLMR